MNKIFKKDSWFKINILFTSILELSQLNLRVKFHNISYKRRAFILSVRIFEWWALPWSFTSHKKDGCDKYILINIVLINSYDV